MAVGWRTEPGKYSKPSSERPMALASLQTIPEGVSQCSHNHRAVFSGGCDISGHRASQLEGYRIRILPTPYICPSHRYPLYRAFHSTFDIYTTFPPRAKTPAPVRYVFSLAPNGVLLSASILHLLSYLPPARRFMSVGIQVSQSESQSLVSYHSSLTR